MKNRLIKMKEEGKKILGTMVNVSCPTTLECICRAGMDFVTIDLEHGHYEYSEMLSLLRAAELCNVVPLVRAKDHTRASILKTVDAGAAGVIAPMIKTVEDAAKMVEYGKFAPLGARGMCPTRCSGYGEKSTIKGHSLPEYFAEANEETLVLPQCETKEYLENLDAILSMDGVDGTLVGPMDLSVSMGCPGDVFCDRMMDAYEKIIKSCKKYNKLSIMTGLNIEHAKQCFDQGFDAVQIGLESRLLIEWYEGMFNAIRG